MNARKKIMRKNKELTVGQKTTLRILSYIGFVICLFFIYKTSSFVIATEKTNGKVIRIDSYRSTARGRSMQYAPVFEYNDSQGNSYISEPGWYSSKSKYNVGQSVEIIYSKQDPSKLKINNFFVIWRIAILSGIISILLLILSKFGHQ